MVLYFSFLFTTCFSPCGHHQVKYNKACKTYCKFWRTEKCTIEITCPCIWFIAFILAGCNEVFLHHHSLMKMEWVSNVLEIVCVSIMTRPQEDLIATYICWSLLSFSWSITLSSFKAGICVATCLIVVFCGYRVVHKYNSSSVKQIISKTPQSPLPPNIVTSQCPLFSEYTHNKENINRSFFWLLLKWHFFKNIFVCLVYSPQGCNAV